MSGVGSGPVGVSYSGYGVPTAGTAPVNAPLPSAINGFSMSGRQLNPKTGDYMFTADGRIVGQATVPQLVQLAITTQLGSSAIPTLGQGLSAIQEKGANFPAQLTSVITSALADLVKNKQVLLGDVVTQDLPSNPDGGTVQFTWTDLTTKTVQTGSIGP